jgi:hypothetical protein
MVRALRLRVFAVRFLGLRLCCAVYFVVPFLLFAGGGKGLESGYHDLFVLCGLYLLSQPAQVVRISGRNR